MFPPSGVIKADLGIQEGGKVHKYFTEVCKYEMIPYIPEGDTHLLRSNGKIEGADTIYYDLPYAHYQYMGELYVMPNNGKGAYYSDDYGYWSEPGVSKVPSGKDLNYHTPGTGAFWDQRMWTSRGEQVIKQVQDYIDRNN